jgi:hypothetical protein
VVRGFRRLCDSDWRVAQLGRNIGRTALKPRSEWGALETVDKTPELSALAHLARLGRTTQNPDELAQAAEIYDRICNNGRPLPPQMDASVGETWSAIHEQVSRLLDRSELGLDEVGQLSYALAKLGNPPADVAPM